MTTERSLVPAEGASPMLSLAAPESEEMPNPLLKVHALLRGRYHWAIILAAILGAGGAAMGWYSTQPVYRASGLIRIEPVLPRVLYSTEQNQMLPMFDAFVHTQAAYITNPRMIEKAMEHHEWKTVGRGRTPEEFNQFQSSLSAHHPNGSELLYVSYVDESPNIAAKAVRSVIGAFEQLYLDTDAQKLGERINTVRGLKTSLESDLSRLENERITIGAEYFTDDLTQVFERRMNRVYQLQDQIREIEVTLGLAGTSADDDGPVMEKGPQPVDVTELTLEQLAGLDDKLRQLLQQKESLETELKNLQYTFGPEHRRVRTLNNYLTTVNEMIAERAELVRAEYSDKVVYPDAGPYQELRQRLAALNAMLEVARADAERVGNKNLAINRIRADEVRLKRELNQVEERLRQWHVEAGVGGRLKVINYGDVPFRPHSDRRKQLAMAGGMFGGAMGVGLVLLIGLLDRRFRTMDDAQDTLGRISMLGILPGLPEDLANPEHASLAAHCVHQIRTLLQIGSESQGRRIYAVTSPGPQDGKTSLSLALGLSFAASGAKTLLIDGDLAGGGLTTRAHAIIRRKIGQILLREHLIDQQQLDHALRLAQETNRRLGETLVDLGYLAQRELDEALDLQEQTPIGLLDALEGEPIESCIAPTGIRGLSVLPIGAADAHDVCKLSPDAIGRMFDEARQHFDVILVDCGPTPGSLAGSHIAVEADAVVLVVARGEQRYQAEKTIKHLYSIGASVAGVVFNRAEGRDVEQASESSIGSYGRRHGRVSTRPAEVESEQSNRFGPVARAVASSASASRAAASGANGNGATNGNGKNVSKDA